ncbi:NUDIX hydrolase [Arthrobacter monumenti]
MIETAGMPAHQPDSNFKSIRVAAGIVRWGDSLLLVDQLVDGRRYWSLPGGVMEENESILPGLAHEIFEESGISARRFGALAHVIELRTADLLSIACVFEVDEWEVTIGHVAADPAGEVIRAQFFSIPETIRLLSGLPWSFMSEPIIEYLLGSGGQFYSYCAPAGSDEPARAQRAHSMSV